MWHGTYQPSLDVVATRFVSKGNAIFNGGVAVEVRQQPKELFVIGIFAL